MKLVTVEAMFPEVKGNCYRTGHGRGSSPRVAIAKAFRDVLKQVSGKRIHTIKATITIIEEAATQKEETQCTEQKTAQHG